MIVPLFPNIINHSLESGIVPDNFKTTHIRAVLKKQSLDHNVLKNYRPVSNLFFLGKTLGRVVINRLDSFVHKHNLYDDYQSANRSRHSTESALLKVQNDILQGMDNGKITFLVLLDPSAAFDTVDHSRLILRLRNRIGVRGQL